MNMVIKRTNTIKWLIAVIITAVFLLIPEQGIYTYHFKLFMAITVCSLSLIAFELVPDLLIAIVMPSLWIFFGVAPVSVVMKPWLDTTMLMICGAFFSAASLEDCGLLKRTAYFLMCQVKGSYFKLLLSIFVAGVIINIITAGQGYLIMAALATGLCISLGAMKTRVGAGIATAAILGTCTSHAYTYEAAAWAMIMGVGDKYIASTAVTPLSIILHCWPMFFVSLLILYIISKWYKPTESLGEIRYFKEKLSAMGKMSKREKSNLFVAAILLLYIFTVDIHGMDISLGFAIIPWLVYLPFLDGADVDTLKKMNVGVIFFVASCMAIGMVASSFGLGETIMTMFTTLLNGSTSPWTILTLLFSIVFGLNFLMTPAAIWSLLTEPMCMLATSIGLSPVPFVYAINLCSEAIILPYEYVPYLIIYSFGMMTPTDFLKTNILRSLIVLVGFLGIIIPYWMLIGLF